MPHAHPIDDIIALLDVRIGKLDRDGMAQRAYDRIFDKYEPIMRRAARGMMSSANASISRGVGRVVRGSGPPEKRVARMADWEKIEENMRSDISPTILGAVVTGGKAVVERKIFKQDRFDPIGVAAVNWTNEHGAALVTNITAATKAGIIEATTFAVNEGWGTAKMARYIRPLVGLTDIQVGALNKKYLAMINGTRNVPPISSSRALKKLNTLTLRAHMYRTNMIARTETAAGLSEGMVQGYGQMGVKRLRWVAFSDACVFCAALDGKEFSLQDAGGMLPEHPLCRCTWVAARPVPGKAPEKLSFHANITGAERGALKTWTGIHHRWMKRYSYADDTKKAQMLKQLVRQEGKKEALRIQKNANLVKDLLLKYKDGIREQGVYRGIQELSAKDYQVFKSLKKGDSLPIDKTMSSWTADESVLATYTSESSNNVQFFLNKGRKTTSELDIGKYSLYADEKKVILAPQRFRVIKIEEEIRPGKYTPSKKTSILRVFLEEIK